MVQFETCQEQIFLLNSDETIIPSCRQLKQMDLDLSQVFNILDENNEGRIRIARFIDIAQNYYSDAEQLASITKALDPTNSGLINYEQFCDGITQISSLQGLTWKEVASDLSRRSRENSLVEDPDRRSLNQDGSTTTFIEYDDDESFLPNHHHPSRTPPTINTNSSISTILNNNHVNNISNNSIDSRQSKSNHIIRDPEEYTGNGNSSTDSGIVQRTPQRLSLVALEEGLLDLQSQQNKSVQSEQQRYNELITHNDRAFSREKDTLQSRSETLAYKIENLDDLLQDSQMNCDSLAEDNAKLMEQLRLEHEELEQERIISAQLAEQLTLDSSKQKFGRTLSRTESIIKNSETRLQDLDSQMRSLKQENERLRQENKELEGRLLSAHFNEGRSLLNTTDESWASELEILSKDELMKKLREQFCINDRYREYIERMLTVIMENNPQLLEITCSASGLSIGSGMSTSGTPKEVSTSLPPLTSSQSVPPQSAPQPTTITRKMSYPQTTTVVSTTSTTNSKDDKYCRL
ncbi:unnamed protein product [Didymodactylos carnosus]|uniref:FIP-RBD domain-containing protein n=1 Tax=Didymodactylos carnosus TaxID=1234261 RepID=A0A813R659_9BILA|nr:unnamed protein product [Didymodactylos carnosus]CAF3561795.1 unnamed protein product [Didymodactylos carnosus]